MTSFNFHCNRNKILTFVFFYIFMKENTIWVRRFDSGKKLLLWRDTLLRPNAIHNKYQMKERLKEKKNAIYSKRERRASKEETRQDWWQQNRNTGRSCLNSMLKGKMIYKFLVFFLYFCSLKYKMVMKREGKTVKRKSKSDTYNQ